MKLNAERLRQVLYALIAFVAGCLAVAVPFFIRASFIHADETARHEQTMEPGITMLMGMLGAPCGGALAVVLWRRFRRRNCDDKVMKPTSETKDSARSHNPYEVTAHSSKAPSAVSELTPFPMTTGVACAVGVFFGAFLAAVIGLGLSFFVLVPPMSHWFDLNGEFDGLLVFLMPPVAAACGAISGLFFALARAKAGRRWMSVAVAGLLSAGVTVIALIGNSHRLGTFVMGCVLFVSGVVSILLVSVLFVHLSHRRARVRQARDNGTDSECPIWLQVTALGLLGMAIFSSLVLSLAPAVGIAVDFVYSLWGTCVFVPVSLLLSCYVAAAWPFQKTSSWMTRGSAIVTLVLVLRLCLNFS